MKITEKKDWCVCKTVVELTSFDRFTIAQAVKELQDKCDAQSVDGPICIPIELHKKLVTLLTKLAGKTLVEDAKSDVFAPDPEDAKPQPQMPEQELRKMDV